MPGSDGSGTLAKYIDYALLLTSFLLTVGIVELDSAAHGHSSSPKHCFGSWGALHPKHWQPQSLVHHRPYRPWPYWYLCSQVWFCLCSLVWWSLVCCSQNFRLIAEGLGTFEYPRPAQEAIWLTGKATNHILFCVETCLRVRKYPHRPLCKTLFKDLKTYFKDCRKL